MEKRQPDTTRQFTLIVTERKSGTGTATYTSYSFTMLGPDGSPTTNLAGGSSLDVILRRFAQLYGSAQ